ncbi:hypothetical protein PSU4_07110 [Pseudonocardia sulfidoxydans NBRC 16205]|uniref:DUF6841 domain-containing protein n=1 Tax=Pseudonocardia sulfidoxydans NBRC 16205 TaxID=1223511 RepID=A0A511DB09_9PSEU|nr:nuclear transport factor 2 family protein [Pseudonocardia sulfidoxydans]GEL21757.1 hypothetical protein PSU4_07110 [Pseudonocardia sulfidoxydans NBRC 16205]
MSLPDPTPVEQAVRAAYADYFACFQRGDAAATAEHFTAPLLRLADGRPAVLPTSDDVRQMLETTFERLRAGGYGSSRMASLEVTVLDRTAALARARGTRHDRAGSAYQEFDVLYTLVRPDDTGWRIATLLSVRGAP